MNKQETLEEEVRKYAELSYYNGDEVNAFVSGAKWMQDKNKYSEEEVINILQEFKRYLSFGDEVSQAEWFEQFKNK